ncbi:MAG: D-glycero-beta-D-manno-heptose-7-phosphate kinase [Desulfobulbaceae bacterium]|nr:D-glycero-beta-D-manno-heptose-7-phosphate kinase [Desulfobulbaceae bacterium]
MIEKKHWENLRQAIGKFPSVNILVVGDIIVDHFIWGSVSRISPEAPVPVVNVTDETLLLGGSANVLHNLYALGAKASICGVIGDDAMGEHLLTLLDEIDSPKNGVIKTNDRPTTKKSRIIAQNQQVVRVDREKSGPLSKNTIADLCAFLDSHLSSFDAVIVSDYSKGVICAPLMDHLRKKLQDLQIPMIVDPKPFHADLFHDATIITPNHHEAELMSGIEIDDDESLLQAASTLLDKSGSTAVLITRGEAGMALLEKKKQIFTIPTVAKEIYDVTGAGDTVIASLSLGLASGLSFAEAATLANFAAGIVVGKVGTATASATELLEILS